MNTYEDCKQQILDWILDQIISNENCSEVIESYMELWIKIKIMKQK